MTHIQCLPLVSMTDPLFTRKQSNDWLCMTCNQGIFPFNHENDDDNFMRYITEFFGNMPSITGLEELVFNPFNINDESNFGPLHDNDPDLQYFQDDSVTSLSSLSSCKYYIEDSFNNQIKNIKRDTFSIFHHNIRSIPRNVDRLLEYLENLNHRFSVIGLSETWLTESNHELFDIPHYNQVKAFRTNRGGGGVSLFIDDAITFKERHDINIANDLMESVFIEIDKDQVSSNKNMIIGLIYKPPNTNMSDFNELFGDLLMNKIKSENKDLYIMGDFNINLLKSDEHRLTSEFLEILFSHTMFPLIVKPTRVQKTTATLIDNIFTNHALFTDNISGILFTDISDHYPIFSILLGRMTKPPKPIIRKRHYNEKNVNNFIDLLAETHWERVFNKNDPRNDFTKFYENFIKLYDKAFPVTVVKTGYKYKKHWLSLGLKTAIKNKNKLYHLSKKHPSPDNVTKYLAYKKQLQKLMKVSEKDHFDYLFEKNKHNLKQTWSIIKSIINKNKAKPSPKEILVNNKLISDPISIADNFNKYFAHIGYNLSKGIPSTAEDPLSYMRHVNVPATISMYPTCVEEVRNVILQLKTNTSGPDDIHGAIVKKTCHLYLEILVDLINLTLVSGNFPDELKIARVCPVFKTGDSKLITNYRPISILPYFSKIFEKIIFYRLASFIDKYNLLYKFQFGFRRNHNTTLALITLVDNIITAADKNDMTLGVCLDFSKAFDTIDHEILLRKLFAYGIRGVGLNLISNYLSDRQQFVHVNNSKSSLVQLSCGVPQGSILGPLLFILYINDLAFISNKLLSIFYADDCNLFIKGSDTHHMAASMNLELNDILKWINCNKLSLNIKKTQCILFKSKTKNMPSNLNIKIGSTAMDRVYVIKFLGVMIDSHLSWEHHAKYIRNKIAKGIGIISKAKNRLKRETLTTLYYSFIYPYFNYAIELWGNLKATDLNALIKIQKRALRTIVHASYRAPSAPIYKSLQVLNIDQIHKYKVVLFMYKVRHGNFPSVICDMFQLNTVYHQHRTRQCLDYHVPIYRKEHSKSNIFYKGVLLWNELNKKIDYNCNYYSFKKRLKRYLLSQEIIFK